MTNFKEKYPLYHEAFLRIQNIDMSFIMWAIRTIEDHGLKPHKRVLWAEFLHLANIYGLSDWKAKKMFEDFIHSNQIYVAHHGDVKKSFLEYSKSILLVEGKRRKEKLVRREIINRQKDLMEV